MTVEMARLQKSVRDEKDAIEAMKSAFSQIAQRIRDLQEDPAALSALADEIDAETPTIVQATLEGTAAAGFVEPTNQPAPVSDVTQAAPAPIPAEVPTKK